MGLSINKLIQSVKTLLPDQKHFTPLTFSEKFSMLSYFCSHLTPLKIYVHPHCEMCNEIQDYTFFKSFFK